MKKMSNNGEFVDAPEPLDPNVTHTINKCSGKENEHATFCKGDCEQVELDELTIALMNENIEWRKAGMNPQAIVPEAFTLSLRLETLIELVLEKFEISEDEYNELLRMKRLHLMRSIREEMAPQVMRQRIAASGPIINPLLGPDGKPIGS